MTINCFTRLIPDSPRWMLAHQQLGKAKTILVKAARANKRDIPKDLNEQLMNYLKYKMIF